MEIEPRTGDLSIPFAVALALHVGLAAALWASQSHFLIPRGLAASAAPAELVDIEVVAPEPALAPVAEPEPVAETEPVAEPEPVAETEPPPPPPPTPPRAPRAPTAPASAEPSPSDEPAGGPPGDGLAPGGVFQLGDVAPAGSVPAGVGRSKRLGPGGDGPGTGGGGESRGSGPPAPVSIASIKRQAMPIGDTDFLTEKDYPDEARRRGIEGPVKVRLVVDDQGRVVDRRLVERLGHGLDQLAMRYASRLRFEPAVDSDDRAVTSVVVWTFRFRLPD
jgi:periplasmic protein TonB